jgi:hypothetical protein
MATPPKYDARTGFVTDYGLSVGAKPVQPGDTGRGNAGFATPAKSSVDTAATNAAREAAANSGQNPSGIYVYKGESAETTKNSLAGDPDYEQLDADNKAMADYLDAALNNRDEKETAAIKEAMALAAQQADPYFKQKINIFMDEFNRAMGTIDADLASHEKNLLAQKTEIERALTVGKEDLSIDQQAELAQEAKNLDSDILTTRDNMAARGLTSSTIRTQAEQKLNEANQYVVEGKKRTYERNIRDLEAKSAYNVNDILSQIDDVRRAANEEKISTTRKAEGYLGSDALAGNANLLGGISGSIIEDKSDDILKRANALMLQ